MGEEQGNDGDEVGEEDHRSRVQIEGWQKKTVKKEADRQCRTLNSHIKRLVLEEIRKSKTPELPQASDEILTLLPKERPDAVVYTAPVVGAKIVTSPNGDGWKGVAFIPERTGSLFAWTDYDLNLPSWARGKKVVRAMRFVVSRIDDEGMSHFRVPDSKFVVSAKWEDGRWQKGFVSRDRKSQSWERGGWFATMEPGDFNLSRELRQLMNMLTRAMTVAGGGLEMKVPL